MGTLRSCSQLRREHELIEGVIAALETMRKSRSRGADVPRLLVTGALDFFTGFVARCHETKEEEALFLVLEARGGEACAIVETLREGRREGERLLGEVRSLASRAALDENGWSMLQAYLALLRRHIATEDGLLFPLAERGLTREDDAAIEKACLQVEERELRRDGNEALFSLGGALARASEALKAEPPAAAGPLIARQIMRPISRTVAPDDSLARAAEVMETLRTREVAVVSDGALLGILTRSDMEPYRGHYEWTQVRAAMTPNPVSIPPAMPVAGVAHLLLARGFNALPVTAGGELQGMVSRSDVLRAVTGEGIF